MKRSWVKISLIFILPNIDIQIFNLRQSQEPMVLKQSAVPVYLSKKYYPVGMQAKAMAIPAKKAREDSTIHRTAC